MKGISGGAKVLTDPAMSKKRVRFFTRVLDLLNKENIVTFPDEWESILKTLSESLNGDSSALEKIRAWNSGFYGASQLSNEQVRQALAILKDFVSGETRQPFEGGPFSANALVVIVKRIVNIFVVCWNEIMSLYEPGKASLTKSISGCQFAVKTLKTCARLVSTINLSVRGEYLFAKDLSLMLGILSGMDSFVIYDILNEEWVFSDALTKVSARCLSALVLPNVERTILHTQDQNATRAGSTFITRYYLSIHYGPQRLWGSFKRVLSQCPAEKLYNAFAYLKVILSAMKNRLSYIPIDKIMGTLLTVLGEFSAKYSTISTDHEYRQMVQIALKVLLEILNSKEVRAPDLRKDFIDILSRLHEILWGGPEFPDLYVPVLNLLLQLDTYCVEHGIAAGGDLGIDKKLYGVEDPTMIRNLLQYLGSHFSTGCYTSLAPDEAEIILKFAYGVLDREPRAVADFLLSVPKDYLFFYRDGRWFRAFFTGLRRVLEERRNQLFWNVELSVVSALAEFAGYDAALATPDLHTLLLGPLSSQNKMLSQGVAAKLVECGFWEMPSIQSTTRNHLLLFYGDYPWNRRHTIGSLHLLRAASKRYKNDKDLNSFVPFLMGSVFSTHIRSNALYVELLTTIKTFSKHSIEHDTLDIPVTVYKFFEILYSLVSLSAGRTQKRKVKKFWKKRARSVSEYMGYRVRSDVRIDTIIAYERQFDGTDLSVLDGFDVLISKILGYLLRAYIQGDPNPSILSDMLNHALIIGLSEKPRYGVFVSTLLQDLSIPCNVSSWTLRCQKLMSPSDSDLNIARGLNLEHTDRDTFECAVRVLYLLNDITKLPDVYAHLGTNFSTRLWKLVSRFRSDELIRYMLEINSVEKADIIRVIQDSHSSDTCLAIASRYLEFFGPWIRVSELETMDKRSSILTNVMRIFRENGTVSHLFVDYDPAEFKRCVNSLLLEATGDGYMGFVRMLAGSGFMEGIADVEFKATSNSLYNAAVRFLNLDVHGVDEQVAVFYSKEQAVRHVLERFLLAPRPCVVPSLVDEFIKANVGLFRAAVSGRVPLKNFWCVQRLHKYGLGVGDIRDNDYFGYEQESERKRCAVPESYAIDSYSALVMSTLDRMDSPVGFLVSEDVSRFFDEFLDPKTLPLLEENKILIGSGDAFPSLSVLEGEEFHHIAAEKDTLSELYEPCLFIDKLAALLNRTSTERSVLKIVSERMYGVYRNETLYGGAQFPKLRSRIISAMPLLSDWIPEFLKFKFRSVPELRSFQGVLLLSANGSPPTPSEGIVKLFRDVHVSMYSYFLGFNDRYSALKSLYAMCLLGSKSFVFGELGNTLKKKFMPDHAQMQVIVSIISCITSTMEDVFVAKMVLIDKFQASYAKSVRKSGDYSFLGATVNPSQHLLTTHVPYTLSHRFHLVHLESDKFKLRLDGEAASGLSTGIVGELYLSILRDNIPELRFHFPEYLELHKSLLDFPSTEVVFGTYQTSFNYLSSLIKWSRKDDFENAEALLDTYRGTDGHRINIRVARSLCMLYLKKREYPLFGAYVVKVFQEMDAGLQFELCDWLVDRWGVDAKRRNKLVNLLRALCSHSTGSTRGMIQSRLDEFSVRL